MQETGAAHHDRRWTQTDITSLRARSLAGESLRSVAEALTRTEGGVRRMSARLALTLAIGRANNVPSADAASAAATKG